MVRRSIDGHQKGGQTLNHINLLNTGIINNGRSSPRRGKRDAAKRTLIVTGIARSGTSLVAGLLRDAGVFMGEFVHDVVEEDASMLHILSSRDMPRLSGIIQERNAAHSTWGFKVPNLHAFMRFDELHLFRDPHLIIIYRDPVAVTVRNSLSEHFGELEGLAAATSAAYALARFVQRVPCPVLLLSYEKALAFPNLVIDSLLSFCDLRIDEVARSRMFLRVQPNREEYLLAARRSFQGSIDGVLNRELYGWCAQDGRLEPVQLELWINGAFTTAFTADHYRADLAQSGIGNGNHAFYVNLEPYDLKPNSVITVRVARRVLELENSGLRYEQLPIVEPTG